MRSRVKRSSSPNTGSASRSFMHEANPPQSSMQPQGRSALKTPSRLLSWLPRLYGRGRVHVVATAVHECQHRAGHAQSAPGQADDDATRQRHSRSPPTSHTAATSVAMHAGLEVGSSHSLNEHLYSSATSRSKTSARTTTAGRVVVEGPAAVGLPRGTPQSFTTTTSGNGADPGSAGPGQSMAAFTTMSRCLKSRVQAAGGQACPAHVRVAEAARALSELWTTDDPAVVQAVAAVPGLEQYLHRVHWQLVLAAAAESDGSLAHEHSSPALPYRHISLGLPGTQAEQQGGCTGHVSRPYPDLADRTAGGADITRRAGAAPVARSTCRGSTTARTRPRSSASSATDGFDGFEEYATELDREGSAEYDLSGRAAGTGGGSSSARSMGMAVQRLRGRRSMLSGQQLDRGIRLEVIDRATKGFAISPGKERLPGQLYRASHSSQSDAPDARIGIGTTHGVATGDPGVSGSLVSIPPLSFILPQRGVLSSASSPGPRSDTQAVHTAMPWPHGRRRSTTGRGSFHGPVSLSTAYSFQDDFVAEIQRAALEEEQRERQLASQASHHPPDALRTRGSTTTSGHRHRIAPSGGWHRDGGAIGHAHLTSDAARAMLQELQEMPTMGQGEVQQSVSCR